MQTTLLANSSLSSSFTDKEIYFFQGDENYEGISLESAKALQKACESFFKSSFSSLPISMKVKNWKAKSLLIFPGGNCSKWDELLSKDLQEQILQWINSGGSILGVCAGAYYCSSQSFYQELFKTRKIALFKGRCQGPLSFCDGSCPLNVVKIRWEENGQEGNVVMILGGELIPDAFSSSSVQVLARFVEPPYRGRIAVVLCQVGLGSAILSTPHWEFNSCDLSRLNGTLSRFYLQELKRKLDLSDNFRQACLSSILIKLSQ